MANCYASCVSALFYTQLLPAQPRQERVEAAKVAALHQAQNTLHFGWNLLVVQLCQIAGSLFFTSWCICIIDPRQEAAETDAQLLKAHVEKNEAFQKENLGRDCLS